MFDIGAPEFILLVVIAIVMFGPEKIPDLARKAAKVVFFLRNIANEATNQIKGELGPEYANLKPSDLNPKTFIQKHLLDQIQDEVNELKQDVEDIKGELTEGMDTISQAGADINAAMKDDGTSAAAVAVATAPFDVEAT